MIGHSIQQAFLTSGSAEGATELNAFDGALLAARIGDLNLVRVTSIMPPRVQLADVPPSLPKGAFVLTVYGARTSAEPGAKLATAVGLGRAPDGFGVVMEASGATRRQVEESVRAMVEEAFRMRGLKLEQIHIAAAEHTVIHCGGVVAACLFF